MEDKIPGPGEAGGKTGCTVPGFRGGWEGARQVVWGILEILEAGS